MDGSILKFEQINYANFVTVQSYPNKTIFIWYFVFNYVHFIILNKRVTPGNVVKV